MTLEKIREQWEYGLTKLCEMTPRPGWEMLVVLRNKEHSVNLYHCHRYVRLGNQVRRL